MATLNFSLYEQVVLGNPPSRTFISTTDLEELEDFLHQKGADFTRQYLRITRIRRTSSISREELVELLAIWYFGNESPFFSLISDFFNQRRADEQMEIRFQNQNLLIDLKFLQCLKNQVILFKRTSIPDPIKHQLFEENIFKYLLIFVENALEEALKNNIAQENIQLSQD